MSLAPFHMFGGKPKPSPVGKEDEVDVLESPPETSKDNLAALIFDDVTALQQAKYAKYAGYAQKVATSWMVPDPDYVSSGSISDSLSDVDSQDGHAFLKSDLLMDQVSGASRDIMGILMGDDASALMAAKYTPPANPAESAQKYVQERKQQEKQARAAMTDMSVASRDILVLLMSQSESVSQQLRACGFPALASLTIPNNTSPLLMDKITGTSRELLSTLLGMKDDLATLQRARYVSPRDRDGGPLLVDRLSEASKGLMTALMAKDEDLQSFQRAYYVAPSECDGNKYPLFMDHLSNASKELMSSIVTLTMDLPAVQRARYADPQDEAPSSTLLMDQMSLASKELLSALMTQSDDLQALFRATYVPPINPAESALKYITDNKEGASSDLLIDQISQASKELLAIVLSQNDDATALLSAIYTAPSDPAASAAKYLSSEWKNVKLSPESHELLRTLMDMEFDLLSVQCAVVGQSGPLLTSNMSSVAKELLTALMVQSEDRLTFEQARYVTPEGSEPDISLPKLIDQLSDTSRDVLFALNALRDEAAVLYHVSAATEREAPVINSSESMTAGGQRLMDLMSPASKELLESLMGKDEDMVSLLCATDTALTEPAESAMRYVETRGGTESLLMDKMSDASRELLALMLGGNDDKTALYRATYTVPPEPAESAMQYVISRQTAEKDYESSPDDVSTSGVGKNTVSTLMQHVLAEKDRIDKKRRRLNGGILPEKSCAPLLTEAMSNASRGLLPSLMASSDDMKALQRARFVASVEPAESAAQYVASRKRAESGLLVDKMSDASKGLLSALMGKDDDAAAFQRATYETPTEPAESAKKYVANEFAWATESSSSSEDDYSESSDSEASGASAPLLTEAMSDASKGLLTTLSGGSDDVEALQKAKFVAPVNPAESVSRYVAARDVKAPLLMEQMSNTSRSLVSTLVIKDDDKPSLYRATHTTPPEPAESAMKYVPLRNTDDSDIMSSLEEGESEVDSQSESDSDISADNGGTGVDETKLSLPSELTSEAASTFTQVPSSTDTKLVSPDTLPAPVEQEEESESSGDENEFVSAMLKEMASTSKDMLAASTLICAASKDLVATVQLVSSLSQSTNATISVQQAMPTVAPFVGEGEKYTASEGEEAAESTPKSSMEVFAAIRNEEDIIARQRLRYEQYIAAASALPDGEDGEAVEVSPAAGETLALDVAVQDEEDSDSEKEEVQQDCTEEGYSEAVDSSATSVNPGATQDEIIAQQRLRYEGYIAAASAMSEAAEEEEAAVPKAATLAPATVTEDDDSGGSEEDYSEEEETESGGEDEADPMTAQLAMQQAMMQARSAKSTGRATTAPKSAPDVSNEADPMAAQLAMQQAMMQARSAKSTGLVAPKSAVQNQEATIAQQQARYAEYLAAAAASEAPEEEEEEEAVASSEIAPIAQQQARYAEYLAAASAASETPEEEEEEEAVAPIHATPALAMREDYANDMESSEEENYDEDYSGSEFHSSDSAPEAPNAILAAIKNEEEVLAQQQARFAQYLLAASELPEGSDEDEPEVEEPESMMLGELALQQAMQQVSTSKQNVSAVSVEPYAAATVEAGRQEIEHESEASSVPLAVEKSVDAIPAANGAAASLEDMFAELMDYDEDASDDTRDKVVGRGWKVTSSALTLSANERLQDSSSEDEPSESSEGEGFDDSSTMESPDQHAVHSLSTSECSFENEDLLRAQQHARFAQYSAEAAMLPPVEQDIVRSEIALSLDADEDTPSAFLEPEKPASLAELVKEEPLLSAEKEEIVKQVLEQVSGLEEEAKRSLPESATSNTGALPLVRKADISPFLVEQISSASHDMLAALAPLLVEQITGASKEFLNALTPLLVAQFTEASKEIFATLMGQIASQQRKLVSVEDDTDADTAVISNVARPKMDENLSKEHPLEEDFSEEDISEEETEEDVADVAEQQQARYAEYIAAASMQEELDESEVDSVEKAAVPNGVAEGEEPVVETEQTVEAEMTAPVEAVSAAEETAETIVEDKALTPIEGAAVANEELIPVEDKSFMPAEDSVVSEELAVEATVPVEEPAVLSEEAIAVEEPAVVSEEAIAVEEPAVVSEEAISVEEPTIETEAISVEEPTIETEAISVEEPTIETEAIIVEEPTIETEAISVVEPTIETEAIAVEEPTIETEAITVEEPAVVAEEAISVGTEDTVEDNVFLPVLDAAVGLEEPVAVEQPVDSKTSGSAPGKTRAATEEPATEPQEIVEATMEDLVSSSEDKAFDNMDRALSVNDPTSESVEEPAAGVESTVSPSSDNESNLLMAKDMSCASKDILAASVLISTASKDLVAALSLVASLGETTRVLMQLRQDQDAIAKEQAAAESSRLVIEQTTSASTESAASHEKQDDMSNHHEEKSAVLSRQALDSSNGEATVILKKEVCDSRGRYLLIVYVCLYTIVIVISFVAYSTKVSELATIWPLESSIPSQTVAKEPDISMLNCVESDDAECFDALHEDIFIRMEDSDIGMEDSDTEDLNASISELVHTFNVEKAIADNQKALRKPLKRICETLTKASLVMTGKALTKESLIMSAKTLTKASLDMTSKALSKTRENLVSTGKTLTKESLDMTSKALSKTRDLVSTGKTLTKESLAMTDKALTKASQAVTGKTLTKASLVMTGTWFYAKRFTPTDYEKPSNSTVM